jgi:hypothetical protein
MTTPTIAVAVTAWALIGSILPIQAAVVVDAFGSGANAFAIEFVDIGNAGNGNDAGAGGGSSFSPHGGVPYNYRMAVTETPQDWITKATNVGMANVTAGAWASEQPAADMTWYEAAAFVNFLNTSTGHHAAYQIDTAVTALTLWTSPEAWQTGGENLYRHKDAYYFLPSEDEWYKAAYHQNDGVTPNYWDYATGSNAIPTAVPSGTGAGTAVYKQDTGSFEPTSVTLAGGSSAYGTMGQNGNAWEWQEGAFIGPNDSSSEERAVRGGVWFADETFLRSSLRTRGAPSSSGAPVGFRVASIPESSTAMMLIGSSVLLLFWRSRFLLSDKPIRAAGMNMNRRLA